MSVNAIALTQQRFKVLIVSLFQKQLQMLRRDFPDLDISATINSTKAGADSGAHGMAVQADRIVVMTKFVSHSTFEGLDRKKVDYCNGGFTTLRRLLESYQAFARINRTKAPPLQAVRIETPPDAVVDYSAFRTCRTGDVLEFIRPDGVAAHVFAQNIYEARRFYEANAGIISTSEIKGGKARVFILDRARRVLHEAEAALLEAPANLSLAFADQRALERLFRDVYMLSFKSAPMASDAHHATVANIAVDGWLEMFKTTGGN